MTDDLRSWGAWREVHQPFELGWWKHALAGGHSVDDAKFAAHWAPVVDFVKPTGVVIDIGCGPRPPFVPCVAIEPLGEEYRKITPPSWWERVKLFSQPAETFIDGLSADTVICWNCIDHAIGWRAILDNMARYAAPIPSARVAIATDFQPPFVGHPGFGRDEFMEEIGSRFEIIEAREPFGRAFAAVMRVRRGAGVADP